MLPTKIVVKIGCAVLLVAFLRPERTGRLAIEAVRSIASAPGDTDARLIFCHSRCMVLFELVFGYKAGWLQFSLKLLIRVKLHKNQFPRKGCALMSLVRSGCPFKKRCNNSRKSAPQVRWLRWFLWLSQPRLLNAPRNTLLLKTCWIFLMVVRIPCPICMWIWLSSLVIQCPGWTAKGLLCVHHP